ncbi:hypothetical protein Q7P37_005492 [Cladosporium fusiforme]
MHKDLEETVGLAQESDGHDARSALEKPHQQPRGYSTKLASSSYGAISLRLIVCAFALLGFVDVFRQVVRSVGSRLGAGTPHCWCGSTDEQAISMGCHYDHMAVDWLPESCIDRVLVSEFDASGPGADGSWPYFDVAVLTESGGSPEFLPINGTEIDDLARVGKRYFATREWHILHCMFTWRKQFRARFDASHIEPWNNNEEHIQHCSDYIMRTIDWGLGKDDVDTQILGVNRHPHEAEE